MILYRIAQCDLFTKQKILKHPCQLLKDYLKVILNIGSMLIHSSEDEKDSKHGREN